MERGYCFHCGAVEMTDKGCALCGGGCGRVATQEEREAWDAKKAELGLVYNPLGELDEYVENALLQELSR